MNPSSDLDWITLKALEKDRTRRYDTAQELAADLGRYLDPEAVLTAARRFANRLQYSSGFRMCSLRSWSFLPL